MICGNKTGGSREPKTYIIQGAGMELQGVIVDEYTVFDACCEDVAAGKVFACDNGVGVGSFSPSNCQTAHGAHEVGPGVEFLVMLVDDDLWDYTSLSAFIVPKSNLHKVEKVIMDNGVYDLTGTKLADVTKDSVNKAIRFNITNNTAVPYVLYYSLCKEE